MKEKEREKREKREEREERKQYLFSGAARHTDVMMFLIIGSVSGGISSRVFFLATAMTTCAGSNPFQGSFLVTISLKCFKYMLGFQETENICLMDWLTHRVTP